MLSIFNAFTLHSEIIFQHESLKIKIVEIIILDFHNCFLSNNKNPDMCLSIPIKICIPQSL